MDTCFVKVVKNTDWTKIVTNDILRFKLNDNHYFIFPYFIDVDGYYLNDNFHDDNSKRRTNSGPICKIRYTPNDGEFKTISKKCFLKNTKFNVDTLDFIISLFSTHEKDNVMIGIKIYQQELKRIKKENDK